MKSPSVLLFSVLPLLLGTACSQAKNSSNPTGATTPGGTVVGAGSGGSSANSPSSGGSAGSGSVATNPKPGGGAAGSQMPAGGTAGTTQVAGGGAGTTGTTPTNDCQGFSFKDLKYSPGGSTLPNKCMPFDATTNNPYAVRCIDAWPWYKTKFPGDQFCIQPPPPEMGIQYGVHPQGKKWFEQVSAGDMSGYDAPGDPFIMHDGEEEQANYETGTTNDKDQNYYRNSARMRPGSHHMIVSGDNGSAPQEVWGPASTQGLFGGISLPGAQRPDENAPKSLEKPDEDKGLYSVLAAKSGVTFNMHHFNVSGGDILKEAWTNLWWESDATIQVHGILGLSLLQTATLNVPAGSIQDLHYSIDITQPVRILTFFGHRHAWTTNFSSWVVKSGGENEILYQSYNWLDEPTYRYDSMTKNPVPAPAMRTDGALSGIRTLMPGEKLHFNCHIEYTNDRATEVNGPMPSQPLNFANEAFTAEMCILFGTTAAVSLPMPTEDTTPLPDFAAKR